MRSSTSELETLFQALADRTRLRLLHLLAQGEICVCYFVEILGESQPKISRHLAYLRRTGLAAARRDGKWMHYSLGTPANPLAARLLSETVDALADDEQCRRDAESLSRACCAVRLPGTLRDAPRPAIRSRPEENEQTAGDAK